ncbi:unnamed protein product [Didymodactylos carnosus]|uniref:G-protein coupled receptors family 1 profile domain-containing protein n=1 Tax=Didymodactylos carnosus TaxID=1234261 RepID=A0A815NVX7_9BILA|nr:unnamed protein product [Didymodactylos carnosus]CAF1442555.1 unnamed protein product [Didymodactylos carnosus]CAF4209854.1 unnamed protein product [Didymodactylos carnosus]CAF4318138.1 unnamed protein product [Didymodactylos carnosus]
MSFNNLSSYSPCHMPPYSLPIVSSEIKLRFSLTVTLLVYLIYLLPFCFGVFGNISVCLIFFQQKKLRSITNTFLMNLCINDLIVLCVSIPMTITNVLIEHFIFGSFLCKLINFTPTVTALVSTFTVAVISVERWFVIVNKKKFNRKCIIIMLILLWLVSISIAIPEYLSRTVVESTQPDMIISDLLHITMNKNYSYEQQQNRSHIRTIIPKLCKMKKIYYCITKPGLRTRVYSYTILAVQYLVPFLFVSVSCYSISRFLKRRIERMKLYNQRKSSDQQPSDIKRFHYKSHNSTTAAIFCHINPDDIDNELTSNENPLQTTIVNIGQQTENYNLINNEQIRLTTASSSFSAFKRLRYLLSRHQEHKNNTTHSLHYSNLQRTINNEQTSRSFSLNPIIRSKIQSHTKRRFHKSRKLLICVATVFMLSWLPLSIVQFYLEHNNDILKTNDADFTYGVLLIPCYLITSLSAWINPIIYNYINRSFRREFYSLYSCCFKNQRDNNSRRPATTISTYKTSHCQTTILPLGKDREYMTTIDNIKNKQPHVHATFTDDKIINKKNQSFQLLACSTLHKP